MRDRRSVRKLPKVLFVDDINAYRDLLPGISQMQLKETIASTYMKSWSLSSTVDRRPVGKMFNMTLDPNELPYPEVKYKKHIVTGVDVSTIDRQLVITFQLGTL